MRSGSVLTGHHVGSVVHIYPELYTNGTFHVESVFSLWYNTFTKISGGYGNDKGSMLW